MRDYSAQYHLVKGIINDMQYDSLELIQNFGKLHHDILEQGAIPNKYKELMALGMAIALRCDGCIAYQMHDAISAGASKKEIMETIGVSVLMGGSPAMMYATEAYRAYHQIINDSRDFGRDDTILEDQLLGE